jgi:hypothetical protein
MILTPRVHGNGFVQLDLTDKFRLNIWGHCDIPRQKIGTQIHDHRFAFRSRVLLGQLGNLRWRYTQTSRFGSHEIYHARPRVGEDTELIPTGDCVDLFNDGKPEVYGPGDTYFMNIAELHESVVMGLAVTLIEKINVAPQHEPRIFVERGKQPDNDFVRHEALPEDKLWQIVIDVLKNADIRGSIISRIDGI